MSVNVTRYILGPEMNVLFTLVDEFGEENDTAVGHNPSKVFIEAQPFADLIQNRCY